MMLLTRRGSGTRAKAAARLRGEKGKGSRVGIVGARAGAVHCMALSLRSDRRLRHRLSSHAESAFATPSHSRISPMIAPSGYCNLDETQFIVVTKLQPYERWREERITRCIPTLRGSRQSGFGAAW